MRHHSKLLILLLALSLAPAVAFGQSQTGTVEGKVMDQQGAVLPGVTLTLTGPRGVQTAVSEGDGVYRFVGLQPATYSLKTELAGFLPQEVQQVIVGMGRTVTLDFTLKIGGLTETVDVRATASTVDVKSSATDTTLTGDLLTRMPIYSSTSTTLMNNAPGINGTSAFGGQSSYGNALLLDGVDTRDPEGGSAWTFFNQNLIQEIQIGGLGAPAEYGGFTGAVVNTITKSGSNAFSGLFSIYHTNDGLAGKNVDDDLLAQNENLGSTAVTKKLNDYTVQLGGPLARNKAFFFANVQRYSANIDPTGPVANNTEISPRFNLKLTLQPNSSNTIIAGLQYDQYNITGRVGWWPSSQTTDNQTVTEDAPEWVWNLQWRKIFGTTTLLETKYTGYTGYYYLDPVDPSPFTYDADTDTYCCGGGGGQYYADRSRNQAQVSLTKYADAFGKHSLKFGAEIERSHVRSQYQYYGPAGFYILAYSGVPYYQVSAGYDLQGDSRRTSLYAQDQWSAGRLTLNIGLRLDRIRGYSPVLDETVYTPAAAWGPRIGVSYDLSNNGSSAIKAFWGRYYEGTATALFTSATPGIQDYVYTPILENGSLGTPEVITPAIVYGIDPDIKHPRTDEFNVSWESQLTSVLRFTATGIWRTTSNFVNNVIKDALFTPVPLTNELTGETFTGYRWANSATSNTSYYIRNVDGFEYKTTTGQVIGKADPSREYKGLMLVLNSSFQRAFGFQVSYVLSKAEGTVDNTGFGNWLGGTQWSSPNTALINTFGELTNSRRHEFKAHVSYQIPKVDVFLGGTYIGYSGRPYAPYGQYSNSQLNLPSQSRRQIYLQPRGSERNDFYNTFDIRAEKAFRFAGQRFGVFADVNNLFNIASVTSRQNRYPSSGGIDYAAPTGVQTARQLSLGARWTF